MAERVTGTATVRAPATSANLGPGFDAFALALELHDEVTAAVVGDALEIDIVGEGADIVPRDEAHLVVRSMRATWDRLGVEQPRGLRVSCLNRLPHGRGLGSSAAAIVSGIRLASALCTAESMADAAVLALATEIEGHPDNVAGCLLGGLTLAWGTAGEVDAVSLPVHPDVRPIAFVPPEPLSTEVARGLLPASVTHADAAANAARAGLLVVALTQRPDLLLPASEDRLHQSYRGPAMPASSALVSSLRASGVAAVVSGAGPTVLALAMRDQVVDVLGSTPEGWSALELAVGSGASVWTA